MDQVLLKTKQELSRRRYSNKTIKAYLFCIEKFFRWVRKDPREVTKDDVKEFLVYLDSKKKSSSTMNLYLSAIKFYFNDVLHRNIKIDFKYSKRLKRIPDYLDYYDLKSLISAIENEKHKLLVELMYSSGLRVSEVVNLKVKDIRENFILIRQGKGSKDRIVDFSIKLRDRVNHFIIDNDLRSEDDLFSGRHGHLTTRSVQMILKNAARKAKIKKVHPHMLRHSYGTHAVMQGRDLIKLQHSMGHKDFRTTLRYTHIDPKLRMKSPYDEI